jgi:hypothetical protein
MLPADHNPNFLSTTNHGAICRVSGRSSKGFSVLSGNSEALRSSRSGDRDHTVGIDHATHGGPGQTHAHVLGRKGNEIGVVNADGTGSHGTRCKLSDEDADALRARGFSIRDDNIVEWVVLEGDQPVLLLD